MKKAMEGIRILDLSQYIAAPYAASIMADLGAEVYKIERGGGSESGDVARSFGPFYDGMSLYFATFNRNKKFMTLNLKTQEGVDLFKQMVPHADIVIQNFRPKVMERLGIGYEELKKINPGIILASISGFGQEGHMAHKPALDSVAAAEGGLMDLTGFPDGKPVKNTMAMTDYLAGYTCVIAMMAALRYRDATGIGQHLDISMLDCVFSTTEYFAGTYALTGEVVTRAGNGRAFSAPSNIYQTSDGRWVNIQAPANNLAFRLFELVGRADLITDPDMQTPLSRKQHEHVCDEAIGAWASQYTAEEACMMLDEHGIPNGRVQDITQVMENPLIRERNMLVRMPDGRLGDVPLTGNPVKLSETPPEYYRTARKHGEDNAECYAELLGLSARDVESMRERNVI